MKTMKDMANRFLAWPLPDEVCADSCASAPGMPGRSGTNLLTATQAEQMLRHVIGSETLAYAVAWLEKRRDNYIEANGYTDPDTGALEFGTGEHAQLKADYVAELEEIIEGLRALGQPANAK